MILLNLITIFIAIYTVRNAIICAKHSQNSDVLISSFAIVISITLSVAFALLLKITVESALVHKVVSIIIIMLMLSIDFCLHTLHRLMSCNDIEQFRSDRKVN
jgi:cytochrome c biogenesis protein CcdA